MIYNRGLFQKCGIPEPSPKGWTWKQFADAVKTLSADEDVVAGFIIDQQINNWVPWFWNNGGPGWFDKGKLVCSLSDKINVDTIRFVLGLGLKDGAAKLRTDVMNLSVTASPFEEGKVGIILGGPWMLPRLRAATGLDWDVAPMPTIRPGMDWSSRYAGMGFSIYSGSKHPSICWDIIKHLTSPEAQKEMIALGEDIPARISVAEKEFVDPDTPWREELFLDAVRHSRPMEEVPKASEVNSIFIRHLDLIWLGRESIEEGSRKMTNEINESLMRDRRKRERWAARHGGLK
jgi:ABC-type glycerol-3-phosphate transport system substrate-binding protein